MPRVAPAISVIVPTRDRCKTLATTLERLRNQAPPERGFEILVVDNGSSDETGRLVEEVERGSAQSLRLIREPKPGPAAARNAGVREAQAPVVLFLGDDMAPADEMLVRGHSQLHDGRTERSFAVLGRVDWDPATHVTPFMDWLAAGRQFAFDRLDRGRVDASRYFYTSNVSIKKDLLDAVGGFNEAFPHAAVEDIELGMRLRDEGIELIYEPSLGVLHDHPTTLATSLRRSIIVGRSAALFYALHPERTAPWRLPARPHWAGKPMVREGLRLLSRAPIPSAARRRIWNVLHAASYTQGYLLGPPAAAAPLVSRGVTRRPGSPS
jgi:glycosyltransferase involved in cell wall biosynthesis